MTEFEHEVMERMLGNKKNLALQKASLDFMLASTLPKYSYNFFWLGRPIIQYPQDMVAIQELIWKIKPDLIIEMGIAHGGSLILSASMLAMLDYCDAVEDGVMINPRQPRRRVLGVDIDIRKHNKEAIESHPMANRIEMIQGSSIDPKVIASVHAFAQPYDKVLICLDSNHTHEHVLAELEAYTPLVSIGSYCVVFDTYIDDIPCDMFPDRPWGPGDNPKTAVLEYLRTHSEFEVDRDMDSKLLISVSPSGYLKRIA